MSAIQIRSGRRLDSGGDLLGPCPFRSGPFLGRWRSESCKIYAAQGTASMGNREGPARTARMCGWKSDKIGRANQQSWKALRFHLFRFPTRATPAPQISLTFQSESKGLTTCDRPIE